MFVRSPGLSVPRSEGEGSSDRPWRWLNPLDADACLREHGVMTDPLPTVPGMRTAPAERRVHTMALAFLKFAWHHPLPSVRYTSHQDPAHAQDWWMTVLVQDHPRRRLALACAVPWDHANVMHPDGRDAFTMAAFPKVLMARGGQAFAEASVHDSMVNAFVDAEQAIAQGALEQAWCAQEEIQLRQVCLDADQNVPSDPRRRL